MASSCTQKRMADIKALFFDIDGTLVSFRTHRVPDSTMQALHEARRQGIRVFISTGRPLQIMGVVSEVAAIADGCITCNGAYCFVGRHTVSLTTIQKECAEHIIDEAKRLGRPCFVVGKDHMAFLNYNDEIRSVFEGKLGIEKYEGEAPLEQVMEEPILQVTPFFDERQEAAVMPRLQGCAPMRWHEAFIDIVPAGVDKARGMEQVARHIGIEMSQTAAFGDGGNDIPMISKAGIGVAMGNARPEVKAAADYVTSSVDDDGIANALRNLGIVNVEF